VINQRKFQLHIALLASLLLMGPVSIASAQTAAITPAGKSVILATPGVPFAGARNADVTVVEFLDFNCPYCKKTAPVLRAFLAADPKVRVLYRDWPIFGGVSVYAARAALAANYQGRYLQAHDALISNPGRLSSEPEVRDRLKGAGVDLARLDRDLVTHAADIDALLKRIDNEAMHLHFEGTPGFVVGDVIEFGAPDLAGLTALAAETRKNAASGKSH
jgi:protein-disulfide isomerase